MLCESPRWVTLANGTSWRMQPTRNNNRPAVMAQQGNTAPVPSLAEARSSSAQGRAAVDAKTHSDGNGQSWRENAANVRELRRPNLLPLHNRHSHLMPTRSAV